jgi:hypothetical protein
MKDLLASLWDRVPDPLMGVPKQHYLKVLLFIPVVYLIAAVIFLVMALVSGDTVWFVIVGELVVWALFFTWFARSKAKVRQSVADYNNWYDDFMKEGPQ